MTRKAVLVLLALLLAASLAAADKELTAREILDRSDLMNNTKDQSSTLKMVLVDKDEKESVREVKLWTKADNRRLIKFLSPADIKGVGFLVLDPDTEDELMYLYLPAFKKVRRIAGSAKSGSFMGSDFSYDDIGSTRYSGDFESKRLEDEGNCYVLELNKREKSDSDYDRLILWVSQEVFVPTRVEFYKIKLVKKKEVHELIKVMKVEHIQRIKSYWLPTRIAMEDVKKKHRTVLEMDDIKVDTGLADSLFTQRQLQR